tara:strand:+ start:314 stop:562 length:249 start_codon:yes stop_codon:yes gene_type:complete
MEKERIKLETLLESWNDCIYFDSLTRRMGKKHNIYANSKNGLIALIRESIDKGFKPNGKRGKQPSKDFMNQWYTIIVKYYKL